MRGGAGHELKVTAVEIMAEAVEQVVAIFVNEQSLARLEAGRIHLGEGQKFRLPADALEFLVAKSDQAIEVADVAILQERIRQHRGERRRYGDGEFPSNVIALQTLHH